MQAEGKIVELALLDGLPAAYISCPPRLIPPPGTYLLAYMPGSDSTVATVVFARGSFGPSQRKGISGFLAAPSVPETWTPGARLLLRGPLGHGLKLPSSARRIALVGFGFSPGALLALLDPGFEQAAAVTLVSDQAPDDLPLQVEVQPLRALDEVCSWADYLAFETPRELFHLLRQNLDNILHIKFRGEAQVLIHTPMPCGGLAECGVCNVEVRGGSQLACVDGPVFDLNSLIGKI